MNKSELVDSVSKATGEAPAKVAEILEAMVGTVQKQVKQGERVTLPGFGTFERRARAARTGRDPQTGEPIKIKAHKVPAFKPGAGFKDFVRDTSSRTYGGVLEPGAKPKSVEDSVSEIFESISHDLAFRVMYENVDRHGSREWLSGESRAGARPRRFTSVAITDLPNGEARLEIWVGGEGGESAWRELYASREGPRETLPGYLFRKARGLLRAVSLVQPPKHAASDM
jgi:DNA-binding protein HU-beta